MPFLEPYPFFRKKLKTDKNYQFQIVHIEKKSCIGNIGFEPFLNFAASFWNILKIDVELCFFNPYGNLFFF